MNEAAVLTDEAREFLTDLERQFRPAREELLAERAPELRGGRGDERPADLAIPEPA